MATRQVVYDDLSSEEGASTRYFVVGEHAQEVDLTDANWAEFQKAIAPFVAVARPAPKRRATSIHSSADPAIVRKWAADNGIEVSAKGRIPAELADKYQAAQSPS